MSLDFEKSSRSCIENACIHNQLFHSNVAFCCPQLAQSIDATSLSFSSKKSVQALNWHDRDYKPALLALQLVNMNSIPSPVTAIKTVLTTFLFGS